MLISVCNLLNLKVLANILFYFVSIELRCNTIQPILAVMNLGGRECLGAKARTVRHSKLFFYSKLLRYQLSCRLKILIIVDYQPATTKE